jgi:hypothetical protein
MGVFLYKTDDDFGRTGVGKRRVRIGELRGERERADGSLRPVGPFSRFVGF